MEPDGVSTTVVVGVAIVVVLVAIVVVVAIGGGPLFTQTVHAVTTPTPGQ